MITCVYSVVNGDFGPLLFYYYKNPTNGNLYTMQDKITINEDYAMSIGRNVDDMVKEKINEGYFIVHSYSHPAVGMCYVMIPC